MIRTITALAVVNKNTPKLNVFELYQLKDMGQIVISDDEKIVKVLIQIKK